MQMVLNVIKKLVVWLGYIILAVTAVVVVIILSEYKDGENDPPEKLLSSEMQKWPYKSNESLKVSIHSNNELWPYEITAQWWPEREKSLPYEGMNIPGVVGRATILISDPISGSSSTITTQFFHVPDIVLTPSNLVPVEITLVNLPHPSLKASEDNISWSTPLLLEDVDFDGDLELVIINHGKGQRGTHEFEVFDIGLVGNKLVATVKNKRPFKGMNLLDTFDVDKKTITSYLSGGACSSSWKTYLVSESKSTPLQSVEYDYDDSGCFKYTYKYNKTDVGLSKVLLEKELAE